ncbi:GxxExxY protein [Granulicella sp. 5B5]|uniref:GxxExxY protein n=1 Tax=Granulicella sp. 5B5 TaxID=1617967 RepID=UPI0015F3A263|nr:GxxExxY protein [Granulicella sp. 5B5]QMV19779.1 GxxExxY protein [Granulicella sp. 5B5]
MTQEELNGLARKILDAAFRVHTALGPGLLETAYTACLVYELRKMGLEVRTEVPVPIVYDGTKLTDVGYRIDILVSNEIVLEIKSVDALAPVHFSQITSYLKLANRRLGFLLNFNVESLRDGIHRRVHRF